MQDYDATYERLCGQTCLAENRSSASGVIDTNATVNGNTHSEITRTTDCRDRPPLGTRARGEVTAQDMCECV